jgi:glutaminyl-tRNA synthetase
MPTICGLRRRGYTPESIRVFAERVGVAKRDNVIDLSLLEFCLREDLNKSAQRRMAVLNPLKVVITNYPEDKTEEINAINNPEDELAGRRPLMFGKEIYIEQDDFMENPPKKYFRLAPGGEVRLRYAYLIKCNEVVKDSEGNVIELRCTYDPESAGGKSSDGRKVKGVIHWLNAKSAVKAEIRLLDRLFANMDPDDVPEGTDWKTGINPDSLKVIEGLVEPALKNVSPLDRFQFERLGYFSVDYDSKPDKLVFNRTVTLRDTWAKISSK